MTLKTVGKIQYSVQQDLPVNVQPVQLMSDDEIKLLRAQILLDGGKRCHLATGILSDLESSQVPTVQRAASYNLAICLQKMGLFTESVSKLSQALNTLTPEELTEISNVFTKGLPQEFDRDVALQLSKNNFQNLSQSVRDSVNYV